MAGFLAAFVQVIGMLAFAVATILIGAFAMGTVPWLAAFLFTLVGMAYAPLVGMAFPDRSGPAYEDLRRRLREAGATLGQGRAAARVSGPFAFLGIAVVVTGSLMVFDY